MTRSTVTAAILEQDRVRQKEPYTCVTLILLSALAYVLALVLLFT